METEKMLQGLNTTFKRDSMLLLKDGKQILRDWKFQIDMIDIWDNTDTRVYHIIENLLSVGEGLRAAREKSDKYYDKYDDYKMTPCEKQMRAILNI